MNSPNPRMRLTKVSEAESESTYGGNDFTSTMDADRAFQLEVESDAIMPVILPPVQPNYTLYNTEPETPPIPDITAIYSKIKRVSHRFGNGWAPTLDSERKGQSETVQQKTGKPRHNNPLEMSKMPWVRKGKEWIKQYRIRPREIPPPPPPRSSSSSSSSSSSAMYQFRPSTTSHSYDDTPISTFTVEDTQTHESTDSLQVKSSLQTPEALQGTGASVVPEKPPVKYPIRLSKGKERALSEKPIPDTLSGVSTETDPSQAQSLSQIPEALENIGPSLVSEKAPTQYPTPLNRAEAPAISEQPSPHILKGVSTETDSPQVQSLSQTSGGLQGMETSVVLENPPAKYPTRLSKGKERALSEQPSPDTLSGVSMETASQAQSLSQIPETLEHIETSLVPGEPPAKYPELSNKGKERALSEQPSPHILKEVSTETDPFQVQSSSQIPEALEDLETSSVPGEPHTQDSTPLNKVEAPAISEQPSPHTLSGVSMETDSPQAQSLSQIPEVLEDIETSWVPGGPPEKYPELLSKGKERALSEQPSPDTLKGVSTEENSPQVQSFPQISGQLRDMEISLDSENSPGHKSQDPSSSDYKSADIVERMPLVIISEVHAGDETDSSSSPPDDLFRNGIEFKPYHRDWFDVGGIWLERNLDTQVCWWPLRSPIPPEESGLTRMSWKCGCGSILSAVISNKNIGRYHSPSSPAGTSSGSVRTAGTSQVSGQLPTRPSAVLATHGRLPSTPQQTASGIPAPSLTETIIANLGTFILCCIRKRQHRTVLVQMDKKTFSNDREFFRNLRVEYRRARGWKRWLSLSCVARIKFIKFVRYYLDYVDCQEFEELPPHTNRDYEYIPKPPENPPVFPVAEFMHYFERPDCAGTATDCLDLVPKRVVGPLEKGRRVEGWGIQPMEGLSMWKFISLLVIVWLGTLAFATWWLAVHPNDLQNAFVPATWAASFAAIGVILPEVLKRYYVLGSTARDAKFPPNLRNFPPSLHGPPGYIPNPLNRQQRQSLA